MKAYKILKLSSHHGPEYRVGQIVYPLKGPDYGCASDDTRQTGRQHASYTLKCDGDYPFTTFPLDDLERIL